MKAIQFSEPWKVQCIDTAEPTAKEGQALIRVRSAGICGSDIGAYRGTNPLVSYPRIIGHEIAGEVLSIPENNPRGIRVGDHVIVDPYLYCGKCYPCSIGRTNCCTSLNVLGVHVEGGMCETFAYPADMLWKLPDDMPWDLAPMARAAHHCAARHPPRQPESGRACCHHRRRPHRLAGSHGGDCLRRTPHCH